MPDRTHMVTVSAEADVTMRAEIRAVAAISFFSIVSPPICGPAPPGPISMSVRTALAATGFPDDEPAGQPPHAGLDHCAFGQREHHQPGLSAEILEVHVD